MRRVAARDTAVDGAHTHSLSDNESGRRYAPEQKVSPTGRFRVAALLCSFLALTALWLGEVNPKRLAVTALRSAVLPAVRSCLPEGKVPEGDVRFAVTTLYLPRDGPGKWTGRQREMLSLSEKNKMDYCGQQSGGSQGKFCSYLNGTRWAEEHYKTTDSFAGLDQIKGGERGVWFKPVYLRSLLRNLTLSGDEPKVDWVLYMDADSMIVNFSFNLRVLLAGAGDDVGLIISRDAESPVNSGVFLLRTGGLGLAVMDGWLSDPKAMERTTDQSFLAKMFDPDTGLMKEKYLKNGTAPRMKMIRQCALQAGGGLEKDPRTGLPFVEGAYARGDFAVHFFGRPDKLEQMRIVDEGSLGFLSR